MNSLTLKCPAKINLLLKLLGKRPDGFNEIYTVIQRVSLFDYIKIKKVPEGFKLNVKNISVPRGNSNILYKAFSLLKKEQLVSGGVDIELQKNIPLAAGLGGGSSDAASFLLGVKKLYNIRLNSEELNKLGGRLGSDVPFFLSNVSLAEATGHGETIRKLFAKKGLWVILVVFRRGLSTKEVYAKFRYKSKPATNLTRIKRGATIISEFLRAGEITKLGSVLDNDLIDVSVMIRPAIRHVLGLLEDAGIKASMMSGSGPTCFAITSTRKEAMKTAKLVRAKTGLSTYVCQTY